VLKDHLLYDVDMNSTRELDSLDNFLLMDAKVLGQCVPKNLDQKQRLERLEQEGYVTAIRHDCPEHGQPPAFSYRLTHLGQDATRAKRQ